MMQNSIVTNKCVSDLVSSFTRIELSNETTKGCNSVPSGLIPLISLILKDNVNPYIDVCSVAPTIVINRIILGRVERVVDPPLVFSISFNGKDNLYEIVGEEGYDDIFLADDTTDNFKDILMNVVIPGLWEEYALESDEKLSPKSLLLKKLLIERVK